MEVQDWAAAAVLFLLVPLSIWGAVEVEDLLSQAPLSPLALLYLPFASVCAIGLATQLGRQASVAPGLQDDPMSTYNLMRIAWTVLIAYQLKPVWDHAKAAWRKDRWRAFTGGVRRPFKSLRRSVLSRRRKAEAAFWRERLNLGPLATPERAQLDVWMEDKANARILWRSRPKLSLQATFLIIGTGLTLSGLLFRLSR